MGAGHRGFQLGLRFWPGRGEGKLALLHATGFCKEVWDPVVEELRRAGFQHQAIGWDQRGHGESAEPALPVDWWDLGRDAAAILGAEDTDAILAVGHSSGATALLMAEVLRPGLVRGIIAIEPIVFPPPFGSSDHPLAVQAARRRDRFSDAAEARDNFEAKFPTWDGRSLDAYLEGGFEARNGELALRCRPEVEADFYRHGHAHGMWDRLDEVSVPVIVVAGGRSDSHPADLIRAQADAIPRSEVAVIDDGGHLVPMERPGAIAYLIRDAWRRLVE